MILYAVCNLLELLQFYVCHFNFVTLEYLEKQKWFKINL